MVFTSLLNWGLLAVVLGVFWLLPARARLYWLAAASVAILAFNDFVAAVLVLYLLVLCVLGPRFTTVGPDQARFRIWLIVILSLVPLVLFKYQNLTGAGKLLSHTFFDPAMLALPLGISYITFKAVMYLIDTGRGRYPSQGLVSLAAYLAFAPSASAGPIDRPLALIQQFSCRIKPRADMFLYAGYRVATGIILKFVIADTLLEVLSSFSPEAMAVSVKKLLLFGPIYAVVIFCDFAGYSHIAIGVGALFGIRLRENFAGPYFRPNISEFWRAWHISLTSFLTDYIFRPLANFWARPFSRRWGWDGGSLTAACLATIVTFVICGIWHGDGLNFAVWGLYHGILLSAHQVFVRLTRKSAFWLRVRRQRWLAAPSTLLTFALVCVGWYPFAMPLHDLLRIFGGGR